MSYIPCWAKYYSIHVATPQSSSLSIIFYSRPTTMAICFPIDDLEKDLAVSDVLQQMRDKPLSERIDNINPPHYKSGDIECIDAIKAALTPEEYRGYLKGNILKYTWRERMKGGLESIKKAIWYLERIED